MNFRVKTEAPLQNLVGGLALYCLHRQVPLYGNILNEMETLKGLI